MLGVAFEAVPPHGWGGRAYRDRIYGVPWNDIPSSDNKQNRYLIVSTE